MGTRQNRSGVPGLGRIESGARKGRWFLDFRHGEARASKLFPKAWTLTMIRDDARAIVEGVIAGTHRNARAEPVTKRTIADLADTVIGHYEARDITPATKHEFRSIVSGTASARSGGKPGGHLVRHLGHLEPHEVTRVVLAEFSDKLRAGGMAALTVRNVVKTVSLFMKIVLVRELDPKLQSNPVRDAFDRGFELPKHRRERSEFLSLESAGRLLASAPEPRRLRYAVALLSGLRDGEIAGLRWEDIDLEIGVIRVRRAVALRGGLQDTKTAAGVRDVPIHPDLAWRLRLTRQTAGSVLGTERPDSARLLKKDLKAIGVAGLAFHKLRASFRTWLADASVHPTTLDLLLGHVPKSVGEVHYRGVSSATLPLLREAVLKIQVPGAGPLRVAVG